MRFEAIEEAKKAARVGNLSPENDLRLNDSHPQLDPYMETEYYRDGKFTRPAFSELG
jgi:hypothetical protein